MSCIRAFGFRPIEKNTKHFRMLCEEISKVVWLSRSSLNVGIQASFTDARLEDVPQSDASRLKSMDACFVWKSGIEANKLAQNAPKQITWMSVVLAYGKGSLTRQASQNQDRCIAICDRRQTDVCRIHLGSSKIGSLLLEIIFDRHSTDSARRHKGEPRRLMPRRTNLNAELK